MTDASARYAIFADDKSKPARDAILRGFKDVDKGIRATLRGLNLAMGLFVGVQLKQMFSRLVRNAEEADAGFAKAMGNVRSSFKDLLTPKGGMAEATAKMEELAEVLKDPTLVAAVDTLVSKMIVGFGNVGIGLAALIHQARVLLNMGGGDSAVDFDDQTLKFQQQRDDFARQLALLGNAPASVRAPLERHLADLDALIAERNQRYWEIVNGPRPAAPSEMLGVKESEGLSDWIFSLTDQNSEALIRATTDSVTATLEEFNADVKLQVGDINASIVGMVEETGSWYDKWNEETKTSLEKQEEAITDFALKLQALMSAGLIDEETAIKRMDAFKESFKSATDEMSEYWKQAQRDMQSATADFLLDPLEDGLDGLLKGFIDTIRRIVAEWAAAKIFSSKSSGGLGVGDAIGAFLGAIFGGGASGTVTTGSYHGEFAKGGSFMVPGSGSTDSSLTMFRATPGEKVTVSPRGAGDWGGVTLVQNIDARGATQDVIATLPRIMRQQGEELEARIVSRLQRKVYDID